MKTSFLLIFVLLAFSKLYAQETNPEFEKVEETKYKIGVGMMPFSFYALSLNGRYKFNNKRELGVSIGGLWNKTFEVNLEHFALVSYLPLKKRERKIGVDLVLSSGIYRRSRIKFRQEYAALPILVGFDLYYNFHPRYVISFNGNIGNLFSSKSIVFPYYKQPFVNFNTFWIVGAVEFKYKIKGRKK